MKTLKSLFTLIILSAIFPAIAQEPQDQPGMKINGFSHPESIILDEQQELIYVSNIGDKNDGDGYISKLSIDGKVLEMKWITGLNDPKGLLLHDGKLFVTDVTEFVEMDPKEGKILKKVSVEGSKSLNDIAVDASGKIYISDLAKGSIFERQKNGEIKEWMHSKELQQPNGLLVSGDSIYIAAWGKDQPGNLLVLDRKTQKVKKITHHGIGNLDGLQRAGNNNAFYVSDWATGKIYRIDTSGNQEEVLTSAKSSGDILFFEAQEELWLPMNRQNAVWIYPTDTKN
jgi:sugar lactone lactonase YvrE